MNAIEAIAGKFRSSNSVPIDRAVVTADEWKAIVDLFEEVQTAARIAKTFPPDVIIQSLVSRGYGVHFTITEPLELTESDQ